MLTLSLRFVNRRFTREVGRVVYPALSLISPDIDTLSPFVILRSMGDLFPIYVWPLILVVLVVMAAPPMAFERRQYARWGKYVVE